MILAMPGGRRQLDRILDPRFLDDLSEMSLDELRDRRRRAMQEESDLSYLRRMLQGRIEILLERRESGTGSDEALVEQLTRALVGHTGTGSTIPQHSFVEPGRIGESRRFVERLLADVALSDPESVSEGELDSVVARFREQESAVSRVRRQVHAVIDRLTAELAARYRSSQQPR
jgi:hypothetical protein